MPSKACWSATTSELEVTRATFEATASRPARQPFKPEDHAVRPFPAMTTALPLAVAMA